VLAERFAPEDQRRMIRLMRDAVQLDPQFLVAWDGLADSLTAYADYVSETLPEQAAQLQAEAQEARRHVAELAPDSWVALRNRSQELLRTGQWAESESVARQLLESGPINFERAQPLADVLFATGRLDECIELQARINALEPRALLVSGWQQFNLYAAGRFEEVEAEYRRSAVLDGNHGAGNWLAFNLGLARKEGDARVLRELYQGALDTGDAGWAHDFGSAIPDRQAMLSVLRKYSDVGAQTQVVLADALGDRELALSLLRTHIDRMRGKDVGAWYTPWLLVHSGARADPRFKELMREGGLADFWRQSGKWPDACAPVGKDDFECR
jgi:tetratricopeptide (TPR) repeat protein